MHLAVAGRWVPATVCHHPYTLRTLYTKNITYNNNGLFGIAAKAVLIQLIVSNNEQNVKLMSVTTIYI